VTDEKKTTKKPASSAKPGDVKSAPGKGAPPAKSAAAKSDDAGEAKKPAAASKGASSYVLPAANPWATAWKTTAAIGGIGAVGAAIGFSMDPKRFAFSYLFGFEVFLSLGLGAIFFVLMQHLTSAGWSITVRRTAELFASGMIAIAILYVPVWAVKGHLFPWLHQDLHHDKAEASETRTTSATLQDGEHGRAPAAPDHAARGAEGGPTPRAAHAGAVGAHAEHGAAAAHEGAAEAGHGGRGDPVEVAEHEVLAAKRPYLNEGFFTFRAVLYLVVWAWIGWKLFSDSTRQDRTKDASITLSLKRFAPPATILFALTLTFAAFDWIMSLEPSWFSTIFGVYCFAGSVVSGLALIIVVTSSIRANGFLEKEISIEHYHDLGKLMFGFLVFWAYIGFSQFMLIWYAALPEETTFFHRRWDEGPWASVSVALIIAHFVIPFFLLLSRNVKRRLQMLTLGASWLLVMHVVDIYWLVMPNYAQADFSVHWLDLACLFAVGGLYLTVVLYQMQKHSLIPVGDPRLPRALHFENA